MEKLVWMENAEEATYVNRGGQTFGYNKGVPGEIRKIEEGEFWAEIEHHHPTHVGSAQIHDDDFKHRMVAAGRPESMHRYYVGCTLFFFDDFVMLVELERKSREPIKPHYYKIATCFHDYKELSQEECRELGIRHYGMFCHVLKCTKCPSITQYDSSG